MKLSIIIPVYNEENTIEEGLNRVNNVDYPVEHEVIAVNDGSSDNTFNILSNLNPDLQFKLISYDENRGKGYAVRKGIEKASGDIVFVQDADLEYDPREIPKVIEPILQGTAQAVYGSRFMGKIEKMTLVHFFGNKFLTACVNILFNVRLTDIETCYKAIRIDVLNNINLVEDGFESEGEITAKLLMNKYRIEEIPISYHARPLIAGKKISWVDGIKTLITILKIRYGIK